MDNIRYNLKYTKIITEKKIISIFFNVAQKLNQQSASEGKGIESIETGEFK